MSLLYRTVDQILDWDQYFMNIAYCSSFRSKDPKCQVGACIVNVSNRVVGTGYNGMPDHFSANSMSNSEACQQRNNDNDEVWSPAMKKYLGRSLQNCRIYVTRIPCNECAKLIVQAGISEVICHSMKPFNSYYGDASSAGKAAMTILESAEVKIRVCRLDLTKITKLLEAAFEANKKHSSEYS